MAAKSAFPLAPSERSDLLQHLVDLVTADPEKKVLIGLFVRLLIQEDRGFSFLNELDTEFPIFFNLVEFDKHVHDSQWLLAKEYLAKFLKPEHEIFMALKRLCENADDIIDVPEALSEIFYAIEAERDKLVNEMQQPKSNHHIPLLCLVEAVRSQSECLDDEDIAEVIQAKEKAEKLVKIAAEKRERARILLQNSELAQYKATMASNIARALSDGASESVADSPLKEG